MPDLKGQGLVLDTSVWINLLATDMVEPILAALGATYYAPIQVEAEITRHPVTGEPVRAEQLNPVKIVELEGLEIDLFFEFVGAPLGNALGDGEAAAIALAFCRGFGLAIDDLKARRILRERFNNVTAFWTVELLQHSSVVNALGTPLAEKCFANARQFGRMHIPSP